MLIVLYVGFYLPLNFTFFFAKMNVILNEIYSRNYHFYEQAAHNLGKAPFLKKAELFV